MPKEGSFHMNAAKKPKQLGFWSIYLLGINGVIGSGAFLLPQTIYQYMDLMSIVVLIAAAITVSLIALCYADLASRFSGAGAAWLYSYHAFGPFVGYELGIFVWFLGCCTVAAETVALFTTLQAFVPAFNNAQIRVWSCIGLVVVFGIINIFGRTLVKWVDNISSGAKIGVIILFIVVAAFFMHGANFHPVLPVAASKGIGAFSSHFGNAFSVVFYMFTGFSFIPIAASQMVDPEKNIPRVLIGVMITVTILYGLMMLFAIGVLGASMVNYSLPIAVAFRKAVGTWGYIVVIIGMLMSIFGVGFATSFNTPALMSSLSNEHAMLPKFFGKTNRFEAPWVAVIITTIVSCFLVTQSYLFLVGMIVFASFVQYVPSIMAVMKFKHDKKFPNHGFSLKGGYTIPIIALLIAFYMVFQFTLKTIILGVCVAGAAAILFVFLDDRKMFKGFSLEEIKKDIEMKREAELKRREKKIEKKEKDLQLKLSSSKDNSKPSSSTQAPASK